MQDGAVAIGARIDQLGLQGQLLHHAAHRQSRSQLGPVAVPTQ